MMNRLLLYSLIAIFPLFLSKGVSAQSNDEYGAIAYSETTGAYGYSYDYSTREQAEARALRECQQRSSQNDCTVLIWFKNACGALAITPNLAYGAAWDTSIDAAERDALQTCSQYGENCEIKTSVCADR